MEGCEGMTPLTFALANLALRDLGAVCFRCSSGLARLHPEDCSNGVRGPVGQAEVLLPVHSGQQGAARLPLRLDPSVTGCFLLLSPTQPTIPTYGPMRALLC